MLHLAAGVARVRRRGRPRVEQQQRLRRSTASGRAGRLRGGRRPASCASAIPLPTSAGERPSGSALRGRDHRATCSDGSRTSASRFIARVRELDADFDARIATSVPAAAGVPPHPKWAKLHVRTPLPAAGSRGRMGPQSCTPRKGAAHVPLARLLGISRSPQRSALHPGRTPSSTRACTRGWAPRRRTATASASAGTAMRRPRACSTASSPPGTTATCMSSPTTSAHRISSPTYARRSAARCSRRTATPSATSAGSSCTTATSTSSR